MGAVGKRAASRQAGCHHAGNPNGTGCVPRARCSLRQSARPPGSKNSRIRMKVKTNREVRYSIVPKDLAGHLFEVSVTVEAPAADGQQFMLPAWIPGSYMIREYARKIVRIVDESICFCI